MFFVHGRSDEITELEVESATDRLVWLGGGYPPLPRVSSYHEYCETLEEARAVLRRRFEAHVRDAEELADRSRNRLSELEEP